MSFGGEKSASLSLNYSLSVLSIRMVFNEKNWLVQLVTKTAAQMLYLETTVIHQYVAEVLFPV